MSEADNQGTSILLPAASIAVYSRDPETLQAARDIENDWRFARVTLQVDEGDVDTAISAYKELQSPDIVIVQTDKIDESFVGQLETLSSQCSEGTAAIVVGPVNDVYLYRRLIEMGVSDYLVRPLTKDVLSEVLAKTIIERIGVSGSRLIAFIGSKGGVGTSALAQATAWGVSDILKQKTMYIDAAGGWSTTGVGMGFEPSTTLAEAARAAANNNEDGLRRMMFKASDRMTVLASGGDVMMEEPVEPGAFEGFLNLQMVTYPVVIVDLSHSSADVAASVITKASQIIVVSTPTLPALRLARSLIQEIKELRGNNDKNIEMVVNMQGMAPKNEVPKKDIEQAMEFKVSSSVPFDPDTFIKLESQSQKIISLEKGAAIVKQSLLPLVQRIISAETDIPEEEEKKSGLFGNIMGKIRMK